MTDWKTSPGVEEDKEYKTLKEIAKKERTQKEFANRKLKKPEEPRQKLLESETPQQLVTKKVMCKMSEPIKPFVVMRAIDLVCGKPVAPSRATVDGTMNKTIFTKPQQIYSRVAAEALSRPGPARPTNRERVAGKQETGLAAWPIGKHDRFGQPAWSEMSGKPGD